MKQMILIVKNIILNEFIILGKVDDNLKEVDLNGFKMLLEFSENLSFKERKQEQYFL